MKLGKKGEDVAVGSDNIEQPTGNPGNNQTPDNQGGQTDTADDQLGGDSADLMQIINEQQAKLTELTNLVQRTRADFENYRKHTEAARNRWLKSCCQ